MINREKVIKGLELLHNRLLDAAKRDAIAMLDASMVAGAIALLKEQEAIEPYMDYDGRDVWRCGKCGAKIFHIHHDQSDEDCKSYAKFCRHCGKPVKWE